jgi:GNAT superfamily N-acetyltransferase
MAIEIQLLKETEATLANNFFNDIYKAERTIENFRWEFFNGPNGKAIYVIAIDTDETNFRKIVGIQCAIPIEFMKSDGTCVLTAKSEDTLVHPDYRGQKLFERMYAVLFDECRKAGIHYIWGFTPAKKAFERLGFEIPFSTSQALLVFKPFKAFSHLVKLNSKNKLIDKIKISGLTIVSFLAGLKRSFIVEGKISWQAADLKSKEGIIQTFYKNTSRYFLRQNDAYLQWRLEKNPFGNQYKNFQSGNPVAEADVLINTRAEISYIEQVLFSQTLTERQKLQIIRKTIDTIKNTGACAIRVLCFPNNDDMQDQINLLKKTGFVYLERGDHFVWKQLGQDNLIDVKDVFFSRLFTQGNK